MKQIPQILKQRIIDESIKLFLKKGFVGTSVKDLIEAAGVAKGTLYWYFKSKNEILENILDKFAKEFIDGLIETMKKCEGDFLKRFKLFFRYTTEFARDHRELLLVFNTLQGEILGSGTDAEKKIKEIQDRQILFVKNLLDYGKRESTVSSDIDTLIYAHIIMATFSGMFLQWYVYGDTIKDVPKYVRCFRKAMLNSLGVCEK